MYLLAGVAVAVAVYLSAEERRLLERGFRVITAVPFWPLYLPGLLAHRDNKVRGESARLAVKDDMAAAIGQVDAELEAALGSLDGWAEDVLAREKDRIHELRTAWTAQAERIREMDRLLALPECAEFAPDGTVNGSAAGERLRHSQQVRRQNIERLRHLRQRAHADLITTLAWVRELVSMIHLAKFTGAPAARAEELVAQIAAAVEGLTELNEYDESAIRAADR